MGKITLIFAFVILTQLNLTLAQSDLYKLHLVSQERGAACLDGSAPGYFIHEGFGENKDNDLLVFAGGGFCGEPTLS